MFCCGVCKVMFNGNHLESVYTTQCGHLFHSKCILLCLNSSSKCPFCSLHVEKNQLVKLNLTNDPNCKDITASFKNMTLTSGINSDEPMNISSNIAQFTESQNKSISEPMIAQNDEDSVVDLTSDVSGISQNFSINNDEQNPHNTYVKVLLTTSFSCVLLSKFMENLLFILNAIIPNSTVQKRLMISDANLISAAIYENYTHVVVIDIRDDFPSELYLINLLKNVKLSALIQSINCCSYDDYIMDRDYTPKLTVKKPEKLSNSQEFVFNFFSEIFPTPDREQQFNYNYDDISVKMCSEHPQIKLKYKAASLSFIIIPHKRYDHDNVFKSLGCIFD